MINLIVAMAKDRVIGAGGKMPWHLPADLRYFKQVTLGHTVFMGRRTFESIGKPLPGRDNVVLSRDPSYTLPGCTVVTGLEAALVPYRGSAPGTPDCFVIGGGQLYADTLPICDRLYVTLIDLAVAGDTYFPEFSFDQFEIISASPHEPDSKNPYPYTFYVLSPAA
jgi:dihydrofolate reductase